VGVEGEMVEVRVVSYEEVLPEEVIDLNERKGKFACLAGVEERGDV
jgi:hypothetical protein